MRSALWRSRSMQSLQGGREWECAGIRSTRRLVHRGYSLCFNRWRKASVHTDNAFVERPNAWKLGPNMGMFGPRRALRQTLLVNCWDYNFFEWEFLLRFNGKICIWLLQKASSRDTLTRTIVNNSVIISPHTHYSVSSCTYLHQGSLIDEWRFQCPWALPLFSQRGHRRP